MPGEAAPLRTFLFKYGIYYARKLPKTENLGLGVRIWPFRRSTAIRPNCMEKPFCHSKLSMKDQYMYPFMGRTSARQFTTPSVARV